MPTLSVRTGMCVPELCAGAVCRSWKNGQGHMVELGRDADGRWGMRQHRLADGSVVTVLPITDHACSRSPTTSSLLSRGAWITGPR
jgi:hypothetical protein